MTAQDNATAIVVAMIEKGMLALRPADGPQEYAETVAETFRTVYAAVKSPTGRQERD